MVYSEANIERVDAQTVRMEITVPSSEVDEAIEKARKTVDALKVRPLGAKQVGDDPKLAVERAVANRATRTVVENAVHEVVASKGLRLTANPQLDLSETVVAGQDFSFSLEASVVPELTIEPFDRLTVRLHQAELVSEEDVDARFEEILIRSANVEKGSSEPVGPDDLVRISFTSTIDGEAYVGNSAEGVGYQMGSLMLPQAFEDGLIGMRAGDEKVVEFVIPSDFDNDEIAGKQAHFDVKVSDVAKVVRPELNDDFAREFGYRDLAHFRETLRGRIAEERDASMEEQREKRAREELAARLIGDVPDTLAQAQSLRMLEAFKLQMKQQGVEFSEYCSYLGITEQDVLAEMREQAAEDVRENLALEALFRHMGIEMTEADKKRTADELAFDSGVSPESLFAEMGQDKQAAIEEMTQHRLATEWLLDHCDFEIA